MQLALHRPTTSAPICPQCPHLDKQLYLTIPLACLGEGLCSSGMEAPENREAQRHQRATVKERTSSPDPCLRLAPQGGLGPLRSRHRHLGFSDVYWVKHARQTVQGVRPAVQESPTAAHFYRNFHQPVGSLGAKAVHWGKPMFCRTGALPSSALGASSTQGWRGHSPVTLLQQDSWGHVSMAVCVLPHRPA